MSLPNTLDKRRVRQLYARPVRQLVIFILAVLLTAQLGLSLYAWALSEQRFLPELQRKAGVVAVSLSAKIGRAVSYGIPFQRLEGVPEFFDQILRENSDLAYLVLSDANDRAVQRRVRPDLLATAGGRDVDHAVDAFADTRRAILVDDAIAGYVHVGVERGYIAARISELRYDIGIVLLTSLLIAFEVLLLIVTLTVSAPMRQMIELMSRMAAGDFAHRARAGPANGLGARLNATSERINTAFRDVVKQAGTRSRPLVDRLAGTYRFAGDGGGRELVQQRVIVVRILTFLFMFAEMLSRPFLPVYAASLASDGGGLYSGLSAALTAGLSDSVRASLPVTAFLLAVALSMPLAGRWSDQAGRRSSYIAGALLVAAGLACAGLVPDYAALVAARAVAGVGYAIMFMSCQGFVADNTDSSSSARGMAMFVGAIMVAEICAPAAGGLLADRIGYRMVFVAGAGVALLAALLAASLLTPSPLTPSLPGARSAGPLPARALARNSRFMALAVLSGIPAKFLYSGFLIFLVPVLLTGMGSSQSEIGRYTMLYGLSALLMAPVFARLADRYRAYRALVFAGGLLTGLGLLPIALGASVNLVLLGIAALGLGQAMSISAQLVLVARVTALEARAAGAGAVNGVFRLLERLGAAAGPVVTGALVAAFGARQATLVLAIGALLAAVLFALAFMAPGRNDSAGAAP